MAGKPKEPDTPGWSISRTALEDRIRRMIDEGECSVVETGSDKTKKLAPTSVGQQRGKSNTIEEINKIILKSGFELKEKEGTKRIYRKNPDDLPNPNLAPDHEQNRRAPNLVVRVSREHRDQFNRLAERFSSKRAALEYLIELGGRMDQHEPE